MNKAEQLKQAMVKKAQGMTLQQLIEAFELTNATNGPEIPEVRGVLMDVLEARNAQAFEAWIDSCAESPRAFFLNAA